MSESRYRIAIGADHGGVDLKDAVARHLMAQGHEVEDFGTHSKDSVNYADFANEVAIEVSQQQFDCGILVCTSGVGVSMAANRFIGVRAANVRTVKEAVTTRQHNDANILCLGQKVVEEATAFQMVEAFLSTEFEGGRHEVRVQSVR